MSNLKSNPNLAHAKYCQLTGLNLTNSIDRAYHWEMFCLRFSIDDLELVIRWIKNEKKMGRPARSTVFRNFIACEMGDRFEEDLQQARNWQEKGQKYRPADPHKARALQSTGRLTEAPPDAKPVGDVIAGMKALNELRALRDSL